MACTNGLWHVKSIKSKSEMKQTIALLLVIQHIATLMINSFKELIEYNKTSDPVVVEGNFVLPLFISNCVYYVGLLLTYTALCLKLRLLPKIVKEIDRYVASSSRSLCSSGDMMAFMLVMMSKLGTCAALFIEKVLHSVQNSESNLMLLIIFMLKFAIELTVDVIPVIITVYCNFISDIIYDTVERITSCVQQKPFVNVNKTGRLELSVVSAGGISNDRGSLTDLNQVGSTSLMSQTLVRLSDILQNLFSMSSWILLLSMIKSTFHLISLAFSVFNVEKMNNSFYHFSLIGETLAVTLVILNISHKLTEEVSFRGHSMYRIM